MNTVTNILYQTYYISLPFNYLYEKAMDILTDALRYPLYITELIKK